MTVEKTDNGYVFRANSPQNHNQYLGESAVAYHNYADCNKAMKRFVSLVRTNNLQTVDEKYLKVEKENDKYYFRYYDEKGCCVFERKHGYSQKANCHKGIKAVFNAVNNT